jgi:hypothetical protein
MQDIAALAGIVDTLASGVVNLSGRAMVGLGPKPVAAARAAQPPP